MSVYIWIRVYTVWLFELYVEQIQICALIEVKKRAWAAVKIHLVRVLRKTEPSVLHFKIKKNSKQWTERVTPREYYGVRTSGMSYDAV